jgi:hypothetical protein
VLAVHALYDDRAVVRVVDVLAEGEGDAHRSVLLGFGEAG